MFLFDYHNTPKSTITAVMGKEQFIPLIAHNILSCGEDLELLYRIKLYENQTKKETVKMVSKMARTL